MMDWAQQYGGGFASYLPGQFPVSPYAHAVAGMPYSPLVQLGPTQGTTPSSGMLGSMVASLLGQTMGMQGFSGGFGSFSPAALVANSQYTQDQNRAMSLVDMTRVGVDRLTPGIAGIMSTVYGPETLRRKDLELLDRAKGTDHMGAYDRQMKEAGEAHAKALQEVAKSFEKGSKALSEEFDKNIRDIQAKRAAGGLSKADEEALAEKQRLLTDTYAAARGEQNKRNREARAAAAEAFAVNTATIRDNTEVLLNDNLAPGDRAAAALGQQARGIAEKIRGLAQNPVAFGMLAGMSDKPGIGSVIDMVMGDRLLTSKVFNALSGVQGMNLDLAGPDPELAAKIASSILQRGSPDGKGTDYGFTRGFSKAAQGSLVEEMSRRGMLPAFDDAGAGVDYSARVTKITDQLGGMLKVMDKMRDIFGRGKSMDQLVAALETITGGSVTQVSASQLEAIGNRITAVADISNVSLEYAANLAGAGAADARQRGLEGILGAEAGLTGLQWASVANGLTGPDSFFARESPQQKAARMTASLLGGQKSLFANRAGGALKVFEDAAAARGLDPTDLVGLARATGGSEDQARKLQGVFDKMRNGVDLTAADLALFGNENVAGLTQAVAGIAGVNAGTVSAALENSTAQSREAFNKAGGSRALKSAQRAEDLKMISSQLAMASGLSGNAADAVVASLMRDPGASREDMVRKVKAGLQSQGYSGSQLDAMATRVLADLDPVVSAMAQSGLISAPNIQTAITDYNDRVTEREARAEAHQEVLRKMEDKFKEKGIGSGSIVSRAMDAFASASGKDANLTLADWVKKLGGGVSAADVVGAEGALTKLQDQYAGRLRDAKTMQASEDEATRERGYQYEQKIREEMVAADTISAEAGQAFSMLDEAAATAEALAGTTASEKTQQDVLAELQKMTDFFSGEKDENGEDPSWAKTLKAVLESVSFVLKNANNTPAGELEPEVGN